MATYPLHPGRRAPAEPLYSAIQQPARVLPLTVEQQAVAATETATLQVNAFAGTGKTATLEAFARARPGRRLLYIAFNKALQQEAAQRFPPNVVAKTCHALAFAVTGRRYQHKLVGKLRPLDLFAPLSLEHFPFADAYLFATAVLETLNRFLASAAPTFTVAHIPPRFRNNGESLLVPIRWLWSLMCDPDNPVGMVHDGYLKLFQLSQPVLAGFDYVLFDEAQDANPAMLDIVRRQSMPQVIVGDRHQQIYGWRGAQNALDALQPTATRYLTRSFRFGPPIAELANRLLATYKGETVAVVGQRDSGRIGDIDRRLPYTVIARTNAGVFDAAAQRVQGRYIPRLHFIGGLQGYPFQRILDAWRLSAGCKDDIRDPWLRTFENFEVMEQLAHDLDDAELKQLCRVVRQYGSRIPALVSQIERCAVATPAAAQVCLSTAHKTKGLEFNQVLLADDFPSLVHIPIDELDPEEVNLLYVAVTRAVEVLEINTSLWEVLQQAKVKASV